MSGRVSAGEDGLHSEHDNAGFNKASGQNQRGFPGSLSGLPTEDKSLLFSTTIPSSLRVARTKRPFFGFLFAFPSFHREKQTLENHNFAC